MYPELAKGFQAVAVDAGIAKVFETYMAYGFAPVSIDYFWPAWGYFACCAQAF